MLHLFPFVFASFLMLIAASPVKAVEPNLLTCPLDFGEWTLIPEFSDEFDGAKLDDTKWLSYNPNWNGRLPGFFSKGNVAVKEGMLHLSAKAEKLPDVPEGYQDQTLTTAVALSKDRIRYGYFEIRCRPMNSSVCSAFWLYAEEEKLWTEIDVFEIRGKSPAKNDPRANDPPLDRTYFTNVHVFITPETGEKHWSDIGTWTAPYRLADDFHVYGFLWSKEELIWYVDGKEIRRRNNSDWHQALNINLTAGMQQRWFGLPDPKDLPSTFSIDYVRVWKRMDGNSPTSIEPPVSGKNLIRKDIY